MNEPRLRVHAIVTSLFILLGSAVGCQSPTAADSADETTDVGAASEPQAGEAAPESAPVADASAGAAAPAEGASELAPPETEKPSEPARPAIDVSALEAVAIPVDGVYRGVEVDGAVVPTMHILGDGAVVRVQEVGLKGVRLIMEFNRGSLPKGYFATCRLDLNNDGDIGDELGRKGIWQMDAEGNITRLE